MAFPLPAKLGKVVILLDNSHTPAVGQRRDRSIQFVHDWTAIAHASALRTQHGCHDRRQMCIEGWCAQPFVAKYRFEEYMSAIHAFPRSEATDPDNVADSLDTGLLHWAKGETAEALRALRQAIELTTEAGNDLRALELARTAADLAPKHGPSAPQAAIAADTTPVEPHRSRLPEPPSPPKKFAGTADADSPSVTPDDPAGDPVAPQDEKQQAASVLPSSTFSVKPTADQPAAASVRPTPPSARVNASSSVTPPSALQKSASLLGPIGIGALQPAASISVLSTGPMSGTAESQAESEKAEPPKLRTENVAAPLPSSDIAADCRNPPGETRPTLSAPSSGNQDERVGPRGDALDHRLASLRVRIERVDADGSVRVRLLDLAATASGEDNALLIVPQILWQELKHSS
jgi:hypothetical protein